MPKPGGLGALTPPCISGESVANAWVRFLVRLRSRPLKGPARTSTCQWLDDGQTGSNQPHAKTGLVKVDFRKLRLSLSQILVGPLYRRKLALTSDLTCRACQGSRAISPCSGHVVWWRRPCQPTE